MFAGCIVVLLVWLFCFGWWFVLLLDELYWLFILFDFLDLYLLGLFGFIIVDF